MIIISCSRNTDADNSTTAGVKKPSKMTITDSRGAVQVLTFEYEENKLKKVLISGLANVPEFFYQNNVLTEFKELATSSEKFIYDTSGKLTRVLSESPSAYFRADFTYDAGGNKINSAKLYRSPTSFWKEVKYDYDAKGNVIKVTNVTDNVVLNRIYDDKNNPFANVNIEFEDHNLLKNDWYSKPKNNCLSAAGVASTGQRGSSTFTYTYDSDNFPVLRVEKSGSTVKETIKFEY
ncbi:hypothetical protein [Flavobacterium oreochromis]|uniref:hypothetical protein n=1 Tax=Flavobacterium oreochromis TaxID=2906078 RepID=UPI00385B5EE3